MVLSCNQEEGVSAKLEKGPVMVTTSRRTNHEDSFRLHIYCSWKKPADCSFSVFPWTANIKVPLVQEAFHFLPCLSPLCVLCLMRVLTLTIFFYWKHNNLSIYPSRESLLSALHKQWGNFKIQNFKKQTLNWVQYPYFTYIPQACKSITANLNWTPYLIILVSTHVNNVTVVINQINCIWKQANVSYNCIKCPAHHNPLGVAL